MKTDNDPTNESSQQPSDPNHDSPPGAIPPRRNRGAPLGNQNARRHGFYSSALTTDEQRLLAETVDFKGLLSEISLLRVKVHGLAEFPSNSTFELLLQALRALTRMEAVHHNITFH